ncbi:hypothetical protein LCGC14_1057750 [marine sediment metagenome]|uniref:DUF3108 domain-containing protein n=1 Tax=marine sediment metagenome TaxID=412755 RepID=A0A0F9Q525_9ZZZZ
MKKKLAKRIALILLFFAIACMELGAQPFKIGEKLTYTVKLFLFSVGEQIFEVKEIVQINGQLTYHLSSSVETSGWANLFLSYNQRLESFVDVDTLYPCQIRSYAQEGDSPPKDIIVQIDQKKGVAFIENRTIQKKWERELSTTTLDITSLIYWLRNQELKVGQIFSFLLLEDTSLRPIKIEVVKKEKVGNDLAFLCSEVDSGKIKIWFSADKNRLPLRIETDVTIGTLTSKLVKIEDSQ